MQRINTVAAVVGGLVGIAGMTTAMTLTDEDSRLVESPATWMPIREVPAGNGWSFPRTVGVPPEGWEYPITYSKVEERSADGTSGLVVTSGFVPYSADKLASRERVAWLVSGGTLALGTAAALVGFSRAEGTLARIAGGLGAGILGASLLMGGVLLFGKLGEQIKHEPKPMYR